MNKQLERRVDEYVKKYKALGDKIVGKTTRKINVKCSYRPSQTAGVAWPMTWRISINIPLHEYHPNELEDTVGHEIAHLYACIFYKEKQHGPAWRKMMVQFGLEPTRCHDMVEAARAVGKKRTQYNYLCSVCNQILPMGPKRHKNMQTGAKKYWHRGCGSNSVLTFIGNDYAGAVSQTPTKPKRHRSSGPTKREQVEMIVSSMHTMYERRQIIESIMQQCDMSKAGATTYYQNAKKKLGL